MNRSPTILSERIVNATQMPQRDFRQSPTAAKPHPVPTTSISNNAARPMELNAECASGLNLQSESSEVPGKRRSAIVRAHMIAPNAKKAERNLIINRNLARVSKRKGNFRDR